MQIPAVNILVLVSLQPPTLLESWTKSLPKGYSVVYRPQQIEDAVLPTDEELAAADAFFMFQWPSNLTSTKQVPNLKLVQLASAGSNHIESSPFYKSLDASHPLIIASASGIHVAPIAEHVIMTTMMLLHNIPKIFLAVRNEQTWTPHAELGWFRELRGLTIGVLGYGHIGREIGRMGQAMGMNVLAATRSGKKASIGGFLVPGTGDHDGDIPSAWYSTDSTSSIHDFYSTADVVVNTLPATSATELYVNADAFKSMKNSSIYVSIGRGQTTDQDALIEALQNALKPLTGEEKEGDLRISGSSLDVTVPEPLGKDSPLYTLPNVVLTPHMSGMSSQYFVRAMELFAQNLDRVVVKGEGGLNAVRGRGE